MDRDTIVEVPASRIALWDANRMVEIDLRRDAAWTMAAQGKVMRAYSDEVTLLRRALTDRNEAMGRQRDAIDQARGALNTCIKERDKLHTWATIGKSAVVIAALATIVIIAQ